MKYISRLRTLETPTPTIVRDVDVQISLIDLPSHLGDNQCCTSGSRAAQLGNILSWRQFRDRSVRRAWEHKQRKVFKHKVINGRFNSLYYQLELQKRDARRRKRSQWTIMCVACGFFSSCILLVAGMLSITSEYQVRLQSDHLSESEITLPYDENKLCRVLYCLSKLRLQSDHITVNKITLPIGQKWLCRVLYWCTIMDTVECFFHSTRI